MKNTAQRSRLRRVAQRLLRSFTVDRPEARGDSAQHQSQAGKGNGRTSHRPQLASCLEKLARHTTTAAASSPDIPELAVRERYRRMRFAVHRCSRDGRSIRPANDCQFFQDRRLSGRDLRSRAPATGSMPCVLNIRMDTLPTDTPSPPATTLLQSSGAISVFGGAGSSKLSIEHKQDSLQQKVYSLLANPAYCGKHWPERKHLLRFVLNAKRLTPDRATRPTPSVRRAICDLSPNSIKTRSLSILLNRLC